MAAKFMSDIGGSFSSATIYLAILIGGVTFTGSMIAWGKLSGAVTQKPVLFIGQNVVNFLIVLAILVGAVWFTVNPDQYWVAVVATGVALLLGIMVVIPIGGADMPVVISLLNSYSGLAACAAGFAIRNNLIITGALVGASGIVLTNIMCKAMNRSLANVLFSGFGAASGSTSGTAVEGEAKPMQPSDAYYILEAASSVVVIPGYGMAVAQAQHAVRELAEMLEHNGTEVKYAIHPVAGRMPGHMNVLLAEANVSYDQDGLVEMDSINPTMETVRGDRDRRQRRGEPGRARGRGQPDLRHADHRRRQGAHLLHPQALHGQRLRRHRQPAVLPRQVLHDLRRRQGHRRRPGHRVQGSRRLVRFPVIGGAAHRRG